MEENNLTSETKHEILQIESLEWAESIPSTEQVITNLASAGKRKKKRPFQPFIEMENTNENLQL